MASVKSPIRKFVKPILFKLLGERGYSWFQFYGKLRDINKRLVEEVEMELLPRFVTAESVVLDIGANYAYYTIRLSQLCPNGKVYAFEPIPSTFKTCKQLVEHFSCRNVELFQKGVGAKNEIAQFEAPLQEVGVISAGQVHLKGRNNQLDGKEKYHDFQLHRTFDCEIVAIDKTLTGLKRLDFIKIDIEGAEYFAFEGMIETLKRFKPVVLTEICPFFLKGFGIQESQFEQFFKNLGYNTYCYNKATKQLESARTPYSDSNYILIHAEQVSRFRNGLIA